MHQMIEGIRYLPVAVYGTLMSGQPNSVLWHDFGTTEPCIIHDCSLVTTNGYFPYGLVAPGSTTVGEALWIRSWNYKNVLARLDRLEGVPSHYRRIVTKITTEEGEIEAWLYSPDHLWDARDAIAIPNNDWRAFVDREYAHPK